MLQAKTMLSSTGNATGDAISDMTPGGAYQAVINGTGVVGTTITIQVSLNKADWLTLGTMVLSGTTTATDGFVNSGEWMYYRAVASGSSGTISNISVIMTEAT